MNSIISVGAAAFVAVSTYLGQLIIGQATTVDTVEKLVATTGVAGGATLIVFLTLRYSKLQQGSWTGIVSRLEKENEQLRERLAEHEAKE